MITDPTLLELEKIKNEIREFKESQLLSLNQHDQNNVVFLLKKVVLFKYIINHETKDYRFKALISDFLYLIDCILNKNSRYYFLNLRSIIEHFLRIFNDICSKDKTPNYDIIIKTKDKIKRMQQETNVNISIITGEYAESCNYVHGNISANFSLIQYYSEISQDNFHDLSSVLRRTCKLIDELLKLFFYSHTNLIDHVFYRRKSILEYLTNDTVVEIIKREKIV